MANLLSGDQQGFLWDWTWARLKVQRLSDIEKNFQEDFFTWTNKDKEKLTGEMGESEDIPIYSGSLGLILDSFVTENLYWDRDDINGYLYPKNLTDKVGIGKNDPTYDLDVNGGIGGDFLQLNTSYSDGVVPGKFSWNSDEGTADLGLNLNVTLQIGQEEHWSVKNKSGADIPDGTVVMATGTVGASGKMTIDKMVADGSVDSIYILGITTELIPNDSTGYVTSRGKIRGLNTALFAEGSVLWADPAIPGGLTITKPSAPNLKLPIAFVVTNHEVNGTIAVRNTTGHAISDSHDVQITSIANNDILLYSSANTRWENYAVGDILSGYVPISRELTISVSEPIVVSLPGTQDLSANRTWALSHADTTGYRHIPSGGGPGQVLIWSEDGTAVWENPTDEYVAGVNFNPSTGNLTFSMNLGDDIIESLDGRYSLTSHTHSYQPLDADLTAIAALTGTTGFLKKTAANTWALDTVGGGYTNLTQFTDQTAWRIFYSDDVGEVKEFAFGSAGQYLKSLGPTVGLTWATPTGGSGTVTSVAMSIPTGFSISGSPITTSGTLGLGFASGYSLPTNLKQGQWDAAYTHSLSAHQTIINGTGFVKASGTTLSYDNSTYDNYGGWNLYVGGVNRGTISSAEIVNFAAGTNVSLGYSSTNNTITINSSGGGDMVYPAAGVGISSGSAWLTPVTGTEVTGNTNDKLLYNDGGTWKYITVPDFVLGQTAQTVPLSTDYLWLTRLTDSFAKESYKVRLSVLSTFFGSGGASISDDAYSSSWNAVTDIGASKNAIYDKIETLANNNLSNLGTTQIYVSLLPGTSSSFDLGSSTYKWRDLYLGGDASIGDDLLLTSSGAVINFYGGDVLLTHSTNKLTVSGGAFVVAGHSGGSDTNRDIPEVINVCYGTDNTPPTTAPEGTLYIQYY